jgi:hypothetical protein
MDKVRIIARLAVLLAILVLVVLIEKPVESLHGKSLDVVSYNANEDFFAYLPLLYTPCGPGELLFSDDFSDPSSGWYTHDTDQSQMAYLNGEFRILVKVTDSFVGVSNGHAGGTDYQLSADVRNATGLPGQYGLLFGFEGGSDFDFYTFEIGPAGDYFVSYNERLYPDPVQITRLHTGWSASIHTGMQSNNLTIIHRSSVIYLYANDQFLTTLPTDKTRADQNGMWATSTTDPNLDVRFDNFEVFQYECYSDTDELNSVRSLGETTELRPFTWNREAE